MIIYYTFGLTLPYSIHGKQETTYKKTISQIKNHSCILIASFIRTNVFFFYICLYLISIAISFLCPYFVLLSKKLQRIILETMSTFLRLIILPNYMSHFPQTFSSLLYIRHKLNLIFYIILHLIERILTSFVKSQLLEYNIKNLIEYKIT